MTIWMSCADLDRILAYYDSKIGVDGLVGRLGYWEFIDWQKQWEPYAGAPEALLHGPSTIINLMYAYALEKAAYLWQRAGRPALAEEYRQRRAAILETVKRLCWDAERGFFREGPDFPQFTQHAQSWAVLNDLVTGEQAKSVLRHAIDGADVLKVSFSTSFEWFRALEKAGMYEETAADMARWAELPGMGNTTCPETPGESRSECHAWSALPIYEFVRVMGGIRVENGKPVIAPVKPYVKDLRGTICVPGGLAEFSYEGTEHGGVYTVHLPDGAQKKILLS